MLFWTTVFIFLITYLIIISEKIHRTVIAMTGALLMIFLGVLTQQEAIAGIDFNTLGLLIGMMVTVTIAKDSGMFQFVAIWAAKAAKGKPMVIFVLLGLIAALFSALLDNVTTVLLMVPVTFVIANNLRLSPRPFLIALILLSNIGGAATLIGDPPNILVGSASSLTFNDFLINMGPIAFVLVAITILFFIIWYRKDLAEVSGAKEKIMRFNPKEAITDKPLLIKSLFSIGLVLVGFATHSLTGFEGASIALAGAAILLLLTANDPEEHLQDVEWTVIFFFIGLFILVAGLEKTGVIDMLAQKLISATQGNLAITTISILWGSAFFSAVVDNIPFVATMIPLIKEIGAITGLPLQPLWWALLLGADIGGNMTLVGASANVVVSGLAEKHGNKISFFEYMKTAVPVTIIALAVCNIYIWFRYL